MEVRVQDFLDDKLQSAADLESLDILLENVKAQQDLLKKQLEDARRDYSVARENTDAHDVSVQHEALSFEQEQEDIDRRLLIVTQSETSDDAVEKFQKSMAKLRMLDVAAGYVELLEEVETIKSSCVTQLGKNDDAALIPYKQLQQLAGNLQPLQDAAEGAAPHLLDYISLNVQELRRTVQSAFSTNMEQTLTKLNWPKSTDRVPLALEKEWTTNVRRLLDLQQQELESRERDRDNGRTLGMEEPPLLPFEVLVRPLEQRFVYHFSGNKPTNRVDKPEYFLNHITGLISEYSDFTQDNLQPILLRQFQLSPVAFTPAYIDATTALITALLPMAKTKLYNVAGQIASQPSLLSHLVQEVIQFDKSLQDSYSYGLGANSVTQPALANFLLEKCGYFQDWLTAERDFALQRYHAIVESSEAGDIDYAAVEADTTKPTKGAIRVNDLLETVTERYRDLNNFSQKIRFLIEIQIEIFDQYYKRLQSSLEAYLTLTSTVGRTMHSVSKEEAAKVQGLGGLDRLCRIFGSADYLERAMGDWSDDAFFLELWAELDYRSKERDPVGRNMGSWQDIQQKTSSALGSENDGTLEGALFDETANSYRRLRVRSENVLIETLSYNLRQVLRPYTMITSWASINASAAGSSVSAELDPTLSLLDEYFTFLRKSLGKPVLRSVTRQVCQSIQSYIWDHVLQTRTSFSTAGATQMSTDMRAICNAIDRHVGAGRAKIGMRKLLEGVFLLSLPVRGQTRQQASNLDSDDEDDSAWDDTNGDGEDGKTMSLFQAERLIFQDNEAARHALEQLGLEMLSEAEARTVLGKRVEISS